jgi:hypothetical protein
MCVLHRWHAQAAAALGAGRHIRSLYSIDDEFSPMADAPPHGIEEARILQVLYQSFAIPPAHLCRTRAA